MSYQLNEAIDVDISSILEKILDLTDVAGCVLRIKVEHQNHIIDYKTIATSRLDNKVAIKIDEHITTKVMNDRKPLQYNVSAQNEATYTCPALAMPLIVDHDVIGVLFVIAYPNVTGFRDDLVQMLNVLSDIIGNLIIYADNKVENANRLNFINEITKLREKIITSKSENDVLQIIITGIQEHYASNWCVLRLLDKNTGELVMEAGNKDVEILAKRVFPKGSMLEKAMQTKKTVTVDDVRTLGRDIWLPYYSKEMISIAVAPIILNGEVIGTLKVYFNEPHFWTEDEIDFLSMLGEMTGLMIGDIRLHVTLKENSWNVIASLSEALDAKDAYTQGHSLRIAKTAVACGRRLNMSSEQLGQLEKTALAHDIGKIGVPDNILLKLGKLEASEFEKIKKHPQIGSEILKKGNVDEEIVLGILQHHEDYDGGGYPAGLKGEEIVLNARIIRVTDAFDAMTSDRPYRKGMSIPVAIELLKKESGKQFDPLILEIFLKEIEDGTLQ